MPRKKGAVLVSKYISPTALGELTSLYQPLSQLGDGSVPVSDISPRKDL